MAKFVLTDAFVSIDGNDLSSSCRSVTINYGADEADDTHFADDTHQFIGGLKTWSMEMEFSADFAASQVDSILFPLVGTTFTVIVRPTSSAVSSTNPNYTGTALLSSFNPIQGAVGDKATQTVTLSAGGTLSRATS